MSGHSFIGRHHELDTLTRAVVGLRHGVGALYLIDGDPGIGKTRLARELAKTRASQSVRVVWGRSWERGDAPAYYLWTQILRGLLQAGASRNEVPVSLKALVDEPSADFDSAQDLVGVENEGARFRLHDSMSQWLQQESSTRPIVLVLDDLHKASPDSLHMLHFISRQIPTMPVLILGTRRPILRRTDDEVAEVLASLAREGTVFHLVGLELSQSKALLAESLGREPSDEWATALHRMSDGNPLLLEELGRAAGQLQRNGTPAIGDDALTSTGGVSSQTPTIAMREIVRSRLDGLSAAAREIIRAAAVLGSEFDATVLAAMTRREAASVVDAIEAGLGAHLFTRSETESTSFTFGHDLFRESIYESLGAVERADLHRRAGESWESNHRDDDHRRVAEVARHFLAAVAPNLLGAGGDSELAVPDRELLEKARLHVTRAARHARAQIAYVDAVNFYEQALRVSDALNVDGRTSIELRIDLARSIRDAGDLEAARQSIAIAIDGARAIGAAELYAQAAIAAVSMRVDGGANIPEHIARLEDALAGLGDGDSATKALTLSQLAQECYFAGDRRRVETLGMRAVEMARRVGDPAVLGTTLSQLQFSLWGPDTVEHRLTVSKEAIRLAEEVGRGKDVLNARRWRTTALLEIGDVAAVDREVEDYVRQAEHFRLTPMLWHAELTRGTRALMSGRLDEVAERGQRALQYAKSSEQMQNALQFLGAQQYALRRERGGLADLEPIVRRNVAELPELPVWRCALALLHAETGRLDEARTALQTGFRSDFTDVPKDGNWLASFSALATVCAEVDDAVAALTLYDLLHPYAHRHVVIGNGAVCLGPVSRFLGRLAAVIGKPQESDDHFAVAVSYLDSIGARQLVARIRLERAGARARLGAPAHGRVLAELAEIDVIADACGMPRLAAQVEALRARLSRDDSGDRVAVGIAREEFSKALRRALTRIDRPDLLKENPLIETALVRGSHPRAQPLEAARVLAARIRRECEVFQRSPRDEIYHQILEKTYFGAPTKQAAVAAELALSYASYRRLHATALRRLEDALWNANLTSVAPGRFGT